MKRVSMKHVSIMVVCVGVLVTAADVSACGFRSAGRISVSHAIKQQTAAHTDAAATGGTVVLVADAGDAALESQLKRANFKVARAADANSAQNLLSGDKNRLMLAPLAEAEILRGAGMSVLPVVASAQAGAARSKGFAHVLLKESSNDQKLDAVRRTMPGAAIP